MKKSAFIIGVLITVFVFAACQQQVELSNISALFAEPVQDGIFVKWEPSSDANCYYVYRAAKDDESYTYWGVTDKTAFTDITVLEGEQYSYRVYPAISTEDGYRRGDSYMNSGSVRTLTKPVISSLQVSNEGCILRWEPIEGAQQYAVYRSSADNSDYQHMADTDINFYIDTTYDGSQAYHYVVEMVSRVNDKAYTSAPSAPVLAARVPAITSAVREDIFTAVLTWEGVAEGAEYGVYRATAPDAEYQLIGTTNQTVFRDTQADDLVSEQPMDYYYKIQVHAVNQDTLSYTTMSQSKKLDASAATSHLFAAQYVDFVSRNDTADANLNQIYADEFERDLQYLQQEGYTTVTSKQVLDNINNTAPLPDKAVMLTIDGARYGVYEYAYPLLKKYNMTAVLSVVGKNADSAQNLARGEDTYCNWDQIKEMAASGHVELAAGGYYLTDIQETSEDGRDGVLKLPYETTDEYKTVLGSDVDLINTKIKELTGQAPFVFAYPTASRDSESDDVLINMFGYKLLLGDNDARRTRMNHFINNAPPETQLLLINRRARLTGTPLGEYLSAAQNFDGMDRLSSNAETAAS